MSESSHRSADEWGDLLWKWLLRISALAAFFYVLIVQKGNVPLGVFVIIGGFAGLPNVLTLQSMLRKDSDDQ